MCFLALCAALGLGAGAAASLDERRSGRESYGDRRGSRSGGCNACFIMMWSMITFVVCLFLCANVTNYIDDDDDGSGEDDGGGCYYVYYTFGPARWVCRGGSRWTSRPISQDSLPPPTAVLLGNNSLEGHGAGDGEPDYWSLYVAVIGGPIASLLTIIATLGPACRRGGTSSPLLVGGVILFAGLLHLSVTICLGVQFFTSEDDEWVYNHFRSEQYYQFDGTLYNYLVNDHYYSGFASLVAFAFFFTLTSTLWELLFMACVLLPNDGQSERLTNVFYSERFSYEPNIATKYSTHVAPEAIPAATATSAPAPHMNI